MFLPEAEKRFWEALYILDYKFLLVPIFFFFLRVWACIQLMIHYYFDVQVPTAVHIALDYLTVSDVANGEGETFKGWDRERERGVEG